MRGNPLNVFSSSQIPGSGREVLGKRAFVDILEDRRLLSASVDQNLRVFAEAVESTEGAGIDNRVDLHSGPRFGKGDGAQIQVGGVNGPQAFGLAPIDDGAGREDAHRSGAAIEMHESIGGSDMVVVPALTISPFAGRFASGRALTGNMRPVASLSAPQYASVFAA